MKSKSTWKFIGRSNYAVFIVDRNDPGKRSLVENAYSIAYEVSRCWTDKRIVCRDSVGIWSEMVPDGTWNCNLVPLSKDDQRRWQEWTISRDEDT
jgi:hypothetical protein